MKWTSRDTGPPGVPKPARRVREEVNTKNMRKLSALALVAFLALALALAVIGCGQKADESSTTTTESNTMMSDTTTMHDSMMVDTSVHQ
jgi:hypothetical protein